LHHADKHEQCLSVIGSRSIQLNIKEKQNTTHTFNFDQVLPENTTQQDVFDCESARLGAQASRLGQLGGSPSWLKP
jgi:hypothetical protein